MPFLTGGYPSLEATAGAIRAISDAGASIIEVGFPFSDPIADGPVIAASMHDALVGGVTPQAIFDTVRTLRNDVDAGLVAMVSVSIVDRLGPAVFVRDAAAAGFDGLIVPDLDIDAADELANAARDADLALAVLIAPTTPADRLSGLIARCTGFVYLLARAGLTGERDDAPDISKRVGEIRAHTDLPIAVGFGISTAQHVRAVTTAADAAIVGSALVRRMGEAMDPVDCAGAFVRELMAGTKRQHA